MSQKTLYGGFAKVTTYFKHPAKTTFEKFVEAYYFSNKKGKTKEKVYKEATQEWNLLKADEDAVSAFIAKNQNLLESRETKNKTSQETFFKKRKVSSSSHIDNSSSSSAKCPRTSSCDISVTSSDNPSTSSAINVPLSAVNVPPSDIPSSSRSSNDPKIPLEIFLDELKEGLSEFLDTLKQEKPVYSALNSLAKSYLTILPDIVFYNENTLRKRDSGLTDDLHQLEDKIQLLKTVIEDTNGINIIHL